MSHLNDEQLYQLVLQQDKAALEELYNRYERILYSFIYRFTKDNGMSEEVMQDLFMKLWQGKASFQTGKGKFSSWILTIARNAAIDRIRKKKVSEVEFDDRDSKPDPESVEQTIVLQEENEYIRDAVSNLPEEQQQVVTLFYFDGEPQKNIAEICQIPLGTVKGRLRLALKHLRKTLSRQDGRGDIYEQ
ncbi:RNA polymerase sigma factor [Alkalicoccobacillus porphyridii]|uniref:Sigma-70 family RNA polymerase sigma factor n=1 Tax=Alkalicoccobacillus porphyridii TaxID=2597270 RepID=A0A553ZVM3_9BACI|nr:sigma-70 family RNA polymerase sigma factor [Alkalicoccobacillus porphyridii]TSB45507.1 sigma-70 family RNA polymerase sigma factor [Alkalicoccobacillus porphyridii]